MARRPVLLAAALAGVCATFAPLGRHGAPLAAPSPVVARVGSMAITAADLERRLAAVPSFQLRAFGKTANEIRREFLDRVLVREALLSQGAADRGLEQREDVRDRIRGVLRTTLLNKLKSEVVSTAHIDDASVKAYYEQNEKRFHTPERYGIWIIATRTKEEADEVLGELKKDPSPKHWSELARAKSIDGATVMKGGNLGFVNPDGTTSEPGLHVSSAVLDATRRLKDTQMATEPVKDSDRWVIVWRKQTVAAVTRTLEVEAGSIRQMLLHIRTDAKVKETIAGLRAQHLTEHNPDLVDLFDMTPQGDLTPVRRPGGLPTTRRLPATPIPTPGSQR